MIGRGPHVNIYIVLGRSGRPRGLFLVLLLLLVVKTWEDPPRRLPSFDFENFFLPILQMMYFQIIQANEIKT